MGFLRSSWRRLSLGTKLYIGWSISGLFLLALTLIIVSLNESANGELEKSYPHQLKLLNNQVTTTMNSLQNLAINLSNHTKLNDIMLNISNLEIASIQQEIHEVVRSYHTYSYMPFQLSLIDLRDKRIYNEFSIPFTVFAHMVESRKPDLEGIIAVNPYEYDGQSELILLRAIPTESFYKEGVVALYIAREDIQQSLRDLTFKKDQVVWLFDATGRILIGSDLDKETQQQLESTVLNQWGDLNVQNNSTLKYKGKPHYLSISPLSSAGYKLVVLTPVEQVLQSGTGDKLYKSAIILILIVIWLLISYIAAKIIHAPLKQLVDEHQIFQSDDEDELKSLRRYIEQIVNANHELEDQLLDYIPDLKLSTFQHLLWGELSETELVNKVERVKLPLKGDLFYVCNAIIDEYGQFLAMYNKNDQLTIHNTLRKTALATYGHEMNCVTFTPHHGIVVILIGVDKKLEHADQVVHKYSELFRTLVKENFSFTISIAISRARRGYSSMSASYREASSMLNYKMVLGNNITVSEHDIENFSKNPSKDIFQLVKRIVNLVVQGDEVEAVLQLEELMKQIPQHTHNSEAMLGMFSYLLGELEYMLKEMGINTHELFEANLYDTLYTKTTLRDVQIWLSETIFDAVRRHLNTQHISKQKRLVQQVNYYIQDLYDTDLSLQDVAEQLGISTSQLSRIYKEETGRTFSDHLIAYRMKKATELLENTNMPIRDIAEKLRYTNVQNFTRIFKQVTTMPPGEYRKQSREE